MMQINTSSNRAEGEPQNPDVEKLQLQQMIQDYLSNPQINKDLRNMVHTKARRFNVNLDTLRSFNPRLATFATKHPIDAIKMFEDALSAEIRGM